MPTTRMHGRARLFGLTATLALLTIWFAAAQASADVYPTSPADGPAGRTGNSRAEVERTPATRGVARKKTGKVSLLFALTAGSGKLIPKNGSDARYKLVLKGTDHDVTWFSDRPARKSGSFPVSTLARAWKGFGFVADPPNAALTYTDPDGNPGRTVILELSHPRYSAGSLSFAARVIDPGTVHEPNLADHARGADREPARHLTDASLFIDSSTAEAGCATAVYGECQNMDLGAVNLSSTGLQYSNYSHSNLDGSNISNTVLYYGYYFGTSLRNVNFEGSFLTAVNLDNADLTGANLKGAKLEEISVSVTNFSGADMEGIAPESRYENPWVYPDFSGANLRHTDLEGLNLEGADFEGADLTGAEVDTYDPTSNFCNAKMPDGTIGPCNLRFGRAS